MFHAVLSVAAGCNVARFGGNDYAHVFSTRRGHSGSLWRQNKLGDTGVRVVRSSWLCLTFAAGIAIVLAMLVNVSVIRSVPTRIFSAPYEGEDD